ncbi:MAG: trypsin-like peptidase domain-containing protein [Candidatus Polarisedimenticolia bacterium]
MSASIVIRIIALAATFAAGPCLQVTRAEEESEQARPRPAPRAREAQRPKDAPRPKNPRQPYPSLEALEAELAALAEATRPSVVGVVARMRAEVLLEGLGEDVRLEHRHRQQLEQALARRVGSGVVIDDQGHVATVVSVVAGASEVEVLTSDGSRLVAQVRGVDPDSGVAVLSVKDGASLRPVRLGDASVLKPGSLVATVSNPQDSHPGYAVGFISGKGVSEGPLRRGPWLKLDAYTAPGSAGGPVFDSKGRMVGLLFGAGGRGRRQGGIVRWEETTPPEPPEPPSAPTPAPDPDPEGLDLLMSLHRPGARGEGVSYAVPVDVVRWVSDRIIARGEVRRGWMGVTIESSQDEPGVVRIKTVEGSGPAQVAGVREGDRILSVMGERVESAEDVVAHISLLEPGESLPLVVDRAGTTRRITVVLRERPETTAPNLKVTPPVQRWVWRESAPAPRLGVILGSADEALRRRLGAPSGVGLLVDQVVPGSRAFDAGMKAGDLLIAIDDDQLRSLDDLRGALRQHREDTKKMKVIRGGKVVVLKLSALPPPTPPPAPAPRAQRAPRAPG